MRANPDGSFVRVRDVARVELGARSVGIARPAGRRPAAVIGIYQSPGGNAIDSADAIRATLEQLKTVVPGGRRLQDHLRHHGVRQGEHQRGGAHAVRGLRARRHRGLSVPRQLPRHPDPADRRAGVADRHLRRHAGARLLRQHRVAAGAGARDRHRRRRRDRGGRGGRGRSSRRIPRSRRPKRRGAPCGEITAPIIAITLVLLSVFVPVAFIPGISGELFRQFAVAVSVSMVISAINALTLSPALCAVFLRARHGPQARPDRLRAARHRQDARRLCDDRPQARAAGGVRPGRACRGRWSAPAGCSRSRRPASCRRRIRARCSARSSCRKAPRSTAPTR